ncbi:DUF2225 domain-containing protein [Clostridium sp. SHJSY1]|uniref:DUF2225 domain-containing protein n=1 Tax=Clostridium sp. SHJSY1 TaxID=2942483 RepID=UPI0028756CC9|nr:DUF2225 domain-containing protein [Clostridium sp. SHJSY1]MDS0525672.1 DUF2225 domain-containing protein [Clostridium sp. SHJSY1]
MDKNTDIFSGLEKLGFENVKNINLYEKKDAKTNDKHIDKKDTEKIDETLYLYDKKVVCPVCTNEFTVRTVKTDGYRMKGKTSDFYVDYSLINPYFYDVWLCNVCGYASMKADFSKLRSFERESVLKNITPRWHGRKYPEVYDINIAIERYKLSLLNFSVIGSKSSKKAMNCLKLAWLYRELGDEQNEKTFREQSLIGFKDAYFNEDFPIYGMNRFKVLYLIGELNRHLGNYEEALRYLSDVITSPSVDRKLKDLAIDQKDLIRETLKKIEEENNENLKEESEEDEIIDDKKENLFSRFFKSKKT